MDGAVGGTCELLVVGHDDESLSHLLAQFKEEAVELLLVAAVQASRGFVGQHDVGLVHQGACHGHPLLLAARELCRLVPGAVGQSHEAEQFLGAALHLAVAAPGDVARDHHVLEGGKFRQQLMKLKNEAQVLAAEARERVAAQGEDIGPGNFHPSGIGAVEGAHDLQQRGLAGTTGSDNADHFLAADCQVDAFEDFQRAERFADVLKGNHIRACDFVPTGRSRGRRRENGTKIRIFSYLCRKFGGASAI